MISIDLLEILLENSRDLVKFLEILQQRLAHLLLLFGTRVSQAKPFHISDFFPARVKLTQPTQ